MKTLTELTFGFTMQKTIGVAKTRICSPGYFYALRR